MRAPKRRRAKRHSVVKPPAGVDLDRLAERCSYVGSEEHKSSPSFAGRPRLRADASKCDPRLTDAEEITSWLRAGIRAGHVGAPWEGDFPRYVWREVGAVWYEARLTNSALGYYKGYPATANSIPSLA